MVTSAAGRNPSSARNGRGTRPTLLPSHHGIASTREDGTEIGRGPPQAPHGRAASPPPPQPPEGLVSAKVPGYDTVGNENQGCLQTLHTAAARRETGERQETSTAHPGPPPPCSEVPPVCSEFLACPLCPPPLI